MFKKILLIATFLLLLPAFAGEYEDALKSGDKIFLYLYTPECGYCTKFNPNYNKLSSIYGNKCKFLKINAATTYGNSIMRNFNAYYVPYVSIIDNKKHTFSRIDPSCLLNYACVQDAVNKFVN